MFRALTLNEDTKASPLVSYVHVYRALVHAEGEGNLCKVRYRIVPTWGQNRFITCMIDGFFLYQKAHILTHSLTPSPHSDKISMPTIWGSIVLYILSVSTRWSIIKT